MDFKSVVENRVSCRQFRQDAVPIEDLREMVRLASLAPSPNNSQPWRFIGVLNRELIAEMGAAVRQRLTRMLPDPVDEKAARARAKVEWFSTFFAQAPAVVAVTLAPYRAVIDDLLEGAQADLSHDAVNEMRAHPDVQSVGAAVEHLLLAAQAMHYGGCWVSGPLMARGDIERLLEIRPPQRLAAMVAIGKPAVLHLPRERDRKPLDEIFQVRL